ncbi:hypothetical protein P8605_21030 [Streptomyces sp. T-3]|nr:hypothetical protein [Streptomyces sp. T-3]
MAAADHGLPLAKAGIQSPPGEDDQERPPGAAVGTDLSSKRFAERYPNPLLHPALLPVAELRLLVSHQPDQWYHGDVDPFSPKRNGAVELVNPLALSPEKVAKFLESTTTVRLRGNVAWRTSIVPLQPVRSLLTPADLKMLETQDVEQLIAVSALNISGQSHSEGVIQSVLKKWKLGPEAKLLGGSERQHCNRCARFYPQSTPTVYAHEYDLNPRETAEWDRLEKEALKKTAGKSPKQQKYAVSKATGDLERLRQYRNGRALDQLSVDMEGVKEWSQKWDGIALSGLSTNFSDAPSSKCPPPKIQLPGSAVHGAAAPQKITLVAAAKKVNPCDEGDESAPSRRRQPGAAHRATGLSGALATPGSGPGGIDFSSMQLRYLSDPRDGSGLQYSFSADRDFLHGDARTTTGLTATDQTSDAFFVWLSLNPSSFWVNLKPDEPHRIVDTRLGQTDAGRIMLQADLRMKKTVGKLIHPDHKVGREFWDRVDGQCMSFRTWILAAPASVRQDGDKLYILEAPLDVKAEGQYMQQRGGSADDNCPEQDQATRDHNERLYRELVLPKLKHAINTAPEYAELRRVYLARVAAEWYRQLSRDQDTTYGDLIDKGDIDAWKTESDWKPTDTFDEFVDSYTNHEFDITRREVKGDTIYERTYIYGGVDLAKMPIKTVDDNRFAKDFADLPRSIDQSLNAPSMDAGDDTILLGAPTPLQAAGLTPPSDTLSPSDWALRLLPVLLLLPAAVLWRRHRRFSAMASSSPLRRATTGAPPPPPAAWQSPLQPPSPARSSRRRASDQSPPPQASPLRRAADSRTRTRHDDDDSRRP